MTQYHFYYLSTHVQWHANYPLADVSCMHVGHFILNRTHNTQAVKIVAICYASISSIRKVQSANVSIHPPSHSIIFNVISVRWPHAVLIDISYNHVQDH